MLKKEFKIRIDEIIYAETPELQQKLINSLYKSTVTNHFRTIKVLSDKIRTLVKTQREMEENNLW